jgi:hypothetical protein
MTSSNNIIIGLSKQNKSIHSSLVAKNIEYVLHIFDDNINDDEQTNILRQENKNLKEIAKLHRPPAIVKEKKTVVFPIKKVNARKNDEDDVDDHTSFKDDDVVNFDTMINLEELKRAFFNNDYDEFHKCIKDTTLKLYKAEYKFSSDKDKSPEYAAKNLLNGFVRSCDAYKKYFMICFRCWKSQNEITYKYESLWIVNTMEPIAHVIGDFYTDFKFHAITDIDSFVEEIKKLPEESVSNEYKCIGESYVH